MYMRKLRASDWLKTSVFFMQHECKIFKDYKLHLHYGLVQFCCLWKIYSCILTPNCARNNKKNSSTISLPAVTSWWFCRFLSSNHITYLPEGLFADLTNLTQLYVKKSVCHSSFLWIRCQYRLFISYLFKTSGSISR